MTVLDFSPTSALSQNVFNITQNGAPRGQIDRGWTGTRATITIGGASYKAWWEGILSATYYLGANGSGVASAQRASIFHRRVIGRAGARTYTLAVTNLLALAFELAENGSKVGTIVRYVTREMQAELPDDLPLEVQAFLIWLAELLITGWAFPAIIASDG